MEGIIIDDYEDKKQCKLLVINKDGSRDYYIPSAGGFVKTTSNPAPATTDHIHSKVSASFRVGNSILTFVNGILTSIKE
jgi:hypothetical protein